MWAKLNYTIWWCTLGWLNHKETEGSQHSKSQDNGYFWRETGGIERSLKRLAKSYLLTCIVVVSIQIIIINKLYIHSVWIPISVFFFVIKKLLKKKQTFLMYTPPMFSGWNPDVTSKVTWDSLTEGGQLLLQQSIWPPECMKESFPVFYHWPSIVTLLRMQFYCVGAFAHFEVH